MDKIREYNLIRYRRNEDIIKNIEIDEAKTNEAMEAIRRKAESHKTGIGPANDLLRFLYILEQQYQSDSNEIRTQTRELVLDYIDQYRQTDDDNEEVQEQDEPSPSIPAIIQTPVVVPPPSQPPAVLSPPPAVVPPPPQQSVVLPPPPQPPVVVSQPSVTHPASSIAQAIDSDCITKETRAEYDKLLKEAEQYEIRYKTIDNQRKKQLSSRIKEVMNKIRKETSDILTNELLDFLNGHEQKVSNQTIRVSSDEERLLCLSILATLILAQLLGGDLNDVKNEIFLPLVGTLSEKNKEFGIIFLDRLHKKCPYTVPHYPKRQATMSDEQYYEAMGYIEKQDGHQRRLETDTEFLTRMNGLIRLFCKLLVRGGPPFDKDLKRAWYWFSAVLNLRPRPNITAILIRVFLDEAGKTMMQTYPKQFPKFITFIREKFIPLLEKETSHDQITRLRLTLDTFMN